MPFLKSRSTLYTLVDVIARPPLTLRFATTPAPPGLMVPELVNVPAPRFTTGPARKMPPSELVKLLLPELRSIEPTMRPELVRSEGRRVGEEGVSKGRWRWGP